MDITLERILSLLPRTPAGKIVRGAKKDFAISLGYDSGDIVSMWEGGSSTSYKKKIHEIASKYNVSVEWLKGETDQKENPATESSEVKVSDEDLRHLTAFHAADEDTKTAIRILLAKYEKEERTGET